MTPSLPRTESSARPPKKFPPPAEARPTASAPIAAASAPENRNRFSPAVPSAMRTDLPASSGSMPDMPDLPSARPLPRRGSAPPSRQPRRAASTATLPPRSAADTDSAAFPQAGSSGSPPPVTPPQPPASMGFRLSWLRTAPACRASSCPPPADTPFCTRIPRRRSEVRQAPPSRRRAALPSPFPALPDKDCSAASLSPLSAVFGKDCSASLLSPFPAPSGMDCSVSPAADTACNTLSAAPSAPLPRFFRCSAPRRLPPVPDLPPLPPIPSAFCSRCPFRIRMPLPFLLCHICGCCCAACIAICCCIIICCCRISSCRLCSKSPLIFPAPG